MNDDKNVQLPESNSLVSRNKSFPLAIILASGFLLLAVSAVALYFGLNMSKTGKNNTESNASLGNEIQNDSGETEFRGTPTPTSPESSKTTSTPVSTKTSDFKSFSSQKLGVSLNAPKDWNFKETYTPGDDPFSHYADMNYYDGENLIFQVASYSKDSAYDVCDGGYLSIDQSVTINGKQETLHKCQIDEGSSPLSLQLEIDNDKINEWEGITVFVPLQADYKTIDLVTAIKIIESIKY